MVSFWRNAVAWRGNVKICAVLLGLGALIAPNGLETAAANGDTRTIYLYHAHRKDSIAATFRVNGHYDARTLDALNWFLRDWRTDEPTKMDPRLFDVLWEAYRACDRMGPDDPIVVLSAYRSPETNAMLRRRSRLVAEHSQHMLGKAMDTTLPGLSMEKLREIGMRMQRGGVGYYPNVPFVHLDVGGVRHWPRMNYDQLSRLFPDGKTVHIPSNGKPLPGYDEARQEILARGGEAPTVEEANNGGIFGFFAKLFGGGRDDEEDRSLESGPQTAMKPRGARPAAPQPDAPPPRQMMANAEADLPRGETFFGAPSQPAQQPGFGRQAVAPQPEAQAAPRLEPAIGDAEAKPAAFDARPASVDARATPLDANAADDGRAAAPDPVDERQKASAPLPPRRPDSLDALAPTAPLPPPRPSEFSALPAIIAHGSSSGSSTGSSSAAAGAKLRGEAGPALAYAPSPAAVPVPPQRPAPAALRAAAVTKAEDQRAAKTIGQMAPARVDRAALNSLATPNRLSKTPAPVAAAGFAPALRAAAKTEAAALRAKPQGAPSAFAAKPAQPSATRFAKDN